MRVILVTIFAILSYVMTTQCRDGSFCPGIQTCCLTPYGVGCCPYPNANCCGDGSHCCPMGYECYTGGCYRSKDHFLTLFKEDSTVFNSTKLTPSIKEKQAPQIFEMIKCAEDLKPFLKDIIKEIENAKDIDSAIRIIESVGNLEMKAKRIFDNCYEKLKIILLEYFN